MRFRPFFLRFCFSFTKYALFHPHFYVSISALTRQSHTGQKFSEKIFCKGVQLYFEISLLSLIHKIFEQNFYLYITVYLVRIWTYQNADEKAHTFSRRNKNVKKRTKTYEKRILCKFTLKLHLRITVVIFCYISYNSLMKQRVYGSRKDIYFLPI